MSYNLFLNWYKLNNQNIQRIPSGAFPEATSRTIFVRHKYTQEEFSHLVKKIKHNKPPIIP